MGSFGNSKKLQFKTSKLLQNHRWVWRTKEGECSFIGGRGELGEDYYKLRVPWGKLGLPSALAFHWPELWQCHWLGCCWARRNQSSSCWGSRGFFPLGMQVVSSQGSAVDEAVGYESAPSWPPDSILNEVSFYQFSQCTIELLFALGRQAVLTQATARMNLEDITPSEISQWQKGRYCMIPPKWVPWDSQIHKDRKQNRMVAARGRGEGAGELVFNGYRVSEGRMKKFWRWWWWLHSVNVLDAAELYI